MGNDAVLTLCHEARLRFLKDHNQSELDLFGKALIQGDAMVIYKSEAFQGDDLEIDIYIDDLSTYGFDFIYKITRVSDQVEIARAKTGMVFFDYESKKVTKIPVEFENFSKI
ncbi:thioesterase-like family protein [Bacteriovorax sp. DB6_IX]|nr:thioesterase-like family protein [Bacteriovorax sp. DB6_IX]